MLGALKRKAVIWYNRIRMLPRYQEPPCDGGCNDEFEAFLTNIGRFRCTRSPI